jgi:hypothetical protein
MEHKQEEYNKLLSSILKENKVYVEIKEYDLKENLESEMSIISFKVNIKNLNEYQGEGEFTCSAEGKGFVDSIWNGLKSCLGDDFKSLKNIEFVSFNLDTSPGTFGSKTNGNAQAKLIIANSSKKLFSFLGDNSFSINSAAIDTLRQALEFLINCEKAVVILEKCIKDAKKRYRNDLVIRFTNELIDLVKITDYSEVLKK